MMELHAVEVEGGTVCVHIGNREVGFCGWIER